jgi:hypothetical protein
MVAVENDYGNPRMDLRASGHEKRSQCKQAYPPYGFISDQEKGFCKIDEVCIEK